MCSEGDCGLTEKCDTDAASSTMGTCQTVGDCPSDNSCTANQTCELVNGVERCNQTTCTANSGCTSNYCEFPVSGNATCEYCTVGDEDLCGTGYVCETQTGLAATEGYCIAGATSCSESQATTAACPVNQACQVTGENAPICVDVACTSADECQTMYCPVPASGTQMCAVCSEGDCATGYLCDTSSGICTNGCTTAFSITECEAGSYCSMDLTC